MLRKTFACAFFLALIFSTAAKAESDTTVTVASLQFGTVNWLLDVIQHHRLDKKYGITLEILPVASKNAAAVALQGEAAHIIVGDWFWVSRQRSAGQSFQFYPYSTASGGLILQPDSSFRSLEDLRGKKIGIAGGKIDKSWLIMQAYSIQKTNSNIEDSIETVYGAPPLLNALLEQKKIDGVLTFWHYQAKLRAKNYPTVLGIRHILTELNVRPNVPINGWIFNQKWAEDNPRLINGFLNAAKDAAHIMKTSDKEWTRLKRKDIIKEDDDAILDQLKKGYQDGIPEQFTTEDARSAEKLFQLVGKLGGSTLIGKSHTMAPNTFRE
ncbi:MAG: ABC transporter substrate-binding protein [Alphaproteobacteria bacterium GM202ARS2]|nr:ABC transporter substrate-binding protein [Alphaproteobacteria bacterium GM202ARS2]